MAESNWNLSARPSHVCFLLVAAPFAYCIYSTVYQYRRLAHIPGPRGSGWSILWLLHKNVTAREGQLFLNLNNKYGNLVRVGPDVLLTSDPDVVRRMNAPRSAYRRSQWQTGMRVVPRTDNVFSLLDEQVHDILRKKTAPGYTRVENPGMEKAIDKTVQELVELVETEYLEENGNYCNAGPLDFGLISSFFTVDVVTRLTFGESFGDLRDNRDNHGYIAMFEDCLRPMGVMANLPSLLRVLEATRILDMISAATLGRTIGMIEPIVDARLERSEKHHQDMLGVFMRAGLQKTELLSETTLQLATGSDTTATAIRSTMLCIITSPRVLTRLRTELDLAKISSPITDAEARQLPYLQAVIKEGMRMYPPVTALLAKQVPDEGDTIDGVFVPGGTKIAWSSLAIQRSPVYGTDPDVFRPERWLETAPQHFQAMSQNLDLVFGYGRFHCLGRSIALLELNKVFVELLRRFDFTVLNPENPWKVVNVGLWFQSEFFVRVTRRDPVHAAEIHV